MILLIPLVAVIAVAIFLAGVWYGGRAAGRLLPEVLAQMTDDDLNRLAAQAGKLRGRRKGS